MGEDAGDADANGTDGSMEDARVDGATDAAVDAPTEGSVEDARVDGATDAAVDAEADGSVSDAAEDGATDAAEDGATDAAEDGGDAAVCVDTPCVLKCEPGWADCDGLSQNGCETDLSGTDNCGKCGDACAPEGGTALCVEGVCKTRCDVSGTYALKVAVQVTWPTSGGIEGGNGAFEYWLRVLTTQQGDDVAAQMLECGRTVPPFGLSQAVESYLFYYPDSLYDAETLPETAATISLDDSTPASSLSMPPVALQLGIDLDDPLNDPWPSTAAEIPAIMRRDMDADGNGGITAHYWGEDGYVYLRTSGGYFPNRTDQVYVASRAIFSLRGALTSCDASEGKATFSHLNSRLFGCQRTSGTACSTTEAEFLDGNTIHYTLGAGDYSLSKVADGASCATIRAALP